MLSCPPSWRRVSGVEASYHDSCWILDLLFYFEVLNIIHDDDDDDDDDYPFRYLLGCKLQRKY